jgi:hypothetical protein
MSYTLRNTIVLGVIFLIVLALGIYFSMIRYPGRLAEVDDQINEIDKELQNTPDLLNQVNTLTQFVAQTKAQWANRNKDIPPTDVTGETYARLIETIDRSGNVKMDMLYNGVKNFEKYGYGMYDLKGDASFEDLFKFLWFIENGRYLYKIRSLELKQAWSKEKESQQPMLYVSYHMMIDAYFSSVPELSASTGERLLQPSRLALNPFYPAILPEIPPNTRDLVEIKRSTLKGVIAGKAYLQDQNKRIRELSEGDEIYLGYVAKIDPEYGKLEYVLNEGGIIDKGELTIRRGEPIK